MSIGKTTIFSMIFFTLVILNQQSFAATNEGIFEFPNGLDVEYTFENGDVTSMTIDQDVKSLIVDVTTFGQGYFAVSLPRALIDAKTGNADDVFFVIINGEQVLFNEEIYPTVRYIAVETLRGDTQIEIIGTQVLAYSAFDQSSFDALSLRYYLSPLPDWAGYANGVFETALKSWEDANPNMEFIKVNSPEQANFQVSWVKDFGGMHVGYALGDFFVEVGLGDSSCDGYWLPYNEETIHYIAAHEVGHILGHEHSTDPNDLMYPDIPHIQYLNEDWESVSAPGYVTFLPLCSSLEVTSYSYDISLDDPLGFDFYFVPSINEYDNYAISPTFNHYIDKGCWAENVRKTSGTCNGVSGQGGIIVSIPDSGENKLITITANLQETPASAIVTEQDTTPEDYGYDPGGIVSFTGSATVKTDKPQYDFQETISISGRISEASRGVNVQVVITDPIGQIVSKSRLVTTSYGDFQTLTAIPSHNPAGSYTISIYNDQGLFLGDKQISVGTTPSSTTGPKEFPSIGGFDELKRYEDRDFGFSIKYPVDWDVDDTVIEYEPYPGQHDGGFSPVGFYNDINYWDFSVSVSKLENDFSAKNYQGQQYLNDVIELLRGDCKDATFVDWGYTCSNHVIVDSKITEIDDKTAYQITETWTQTLSDGSIFRNLSILTDIPVGNDVWTVDTVNTASEYPNKANTIELIINSFDIFDGAQPTPTRDDVSPLIMTPSDITVEAEDKFGAVVDYSVKAIDDVDGVIRVTCTPLPSSYFPIGDTTVNCSASDSSGNSVEKSFKVTVGVTSVIIPDWIKEVAAFWCDDKIDDASFIEGIQYLIENGIIIVQATTSGSGGTQEIPSWVKNNACWWSQGLIADEDFASGLKYLIEIGVIKIEVLYSSPYTR